MNVIVCGTRKAYEDDARTYLYQALDALNFRGGLRLLHGDCPNSPDMWAAEWCQDTDTTVEAFPAQWEAFGKAAGNMRNASMALYADQLPGDSRCIAVWDGKSPGTLNMIKEATRRGIPVEIIPARVP